MKKNPQDEAAKYTDTCCFTCKFSGVNLWLCLQEDCKFVGCSEAVEDHSSVHSQESNHPLTMNLQTQRVWCYTCECEAFYSKAADEFISHRHKKQSRSKSESSYGASYYTGTFNDVDDSDTEDFSLSRPRGLTGLRNLGNSCYMNAAIQSLSNCQPLSRFFIDCPGFLSCAREATLSKIYMKLVNEMWHRKRASYLSPTSLFSCMKQQHPMFRGCLQHDSQEFLRFLMDTLHEELKEVMPELDVFAESTLTIPSNYPSNFSSNNMIDLGYDSCSNQDKNLGINIKENGDVNECGDGRHKVTLSSDDKSSLTLTCDSRDTTRPHSPASVTEEDRRNHNDMNMKEKKVPTYLSIISDVFDGQILSSVQCMTCKNISTTKETFQDLSLPIPSSEQLTVLNSSSLKSMADETSKKPSWFSWFYSFFQGMFWGPTIHLQDCLASFFSADELKGDNMYSCEKCKKLRNGVKYSKVLKLPEVLCVHLKRFRYDYMFASSTSSKLSSTVNFPLERLDMQQHLHKDCKDAVTSYSLVAVICHHGGASGGHYTAHALNAHNHSWYEFDDQIVSKVDLSQVENSQAYVLFYQKIDDHMMPLRNRVDEFFKEDGDDLIKFYISRKWISKFNSFAEPGPINNYDFLCRHGFLKPKCSNIISDLVIELPTVLWGYFHSKFGGGPAVNHLKSCETCQMEGAALKRRRETELTTFLQLTKAFNENQNGTVVALSMTWFRSWEAFVKQTTDTPPQKIDNSRICTFRGNTPVLLANSDYGQMSEETWDFLHGIYAGGPLVIINQGRPHPCNNSQYNET